MSRGPGRSGVVEPPRDRHRRRGALLVLLCLGLLLHPVVGNGPGPDPRTVYTGEPVALSTEPREGGFAVAPGVSGDFIVTGAVRRAANGSYSRPARNISENLRGLVDHGYYWDRTGDQYYAIDAAIADGTFRLDARPVEPRTVAEAVATPATDARPPAAAAARGDYRHVVDTGRTVPYGAEDPTLVAADGEYVLVRRSLEALPDPYRSVKLGGYALAGAGIALGVVLPAMAGRDEE